MIHFSELSCKFIFPNISWKVKRHNVKMFSMQGKSATHTTSPINSMGLNVLVLLSLTTSEARPRKGDFQAIVGHIQRWCRVE